MNDMPLASDSLDYVYACEVLHHNDADGLRRTFEEAYRVLKPGGRMLVVNETLKTLHDPVGVHAEAVAQFEGYEHAHWAAQYRWGAVRAGFSTALLEPTYHWFYRVPPLRRTLRRCATGAPASNDELRRRPWRAQAVPVVDQPRRRRTVVRDDRHQSPAPAARRSRRTAARTRSEILGDARRGPVEHHEPEHEDRHRDRRPGSPAAS